MEVVVLKGLGYREPLAIRTHPVVWMHSRMSCGGVVVIPTYVVLVLGLLVSIRRDGTHHGPSPLRGGLSHGLHTHHAVGMRDVRRDVRRDG